MMIQRYVVLAIVGLRFLIEPQFLDICPYIRGLVLNELPGCATA